MIAHLLFLFLSFAQIEDREIIERSIPNTNKLLVDNVNGAIRITGVPGSELRFKAEKHITANSPEAMAEAKRDVKLDVSPQGSFVRLFLDGPFRGHDRGSQYYGYKVSVDYDIQVPFDAELILKNVNGGITADKVACACTISSVNGSVKISFSRNPKQPSSFHTVNGGIEVRLQAPLNADLKLQTVNGSIFSDFDVAPLSANPGQTEAGKGKFVYRSDKNRSVRAGSGGPELTLQTVNGNISLRTKGN
jgi:hypothetical protein